MVSLSKVIKKVTPSLFVRFPERFYRFESVTQEGEAVPTTHSPAKVAHFEGVWAISGMPSSRDSARSISSPGRGGRQVCEKLRLQPRCLRRAIALAARTFSAFNTKPTVNKKISISIAFLDGANITGRASIRI